MKKQILTTLFLLFLGIFLSGAMQAQAIKVSGKVTDASDGSSLIGVTIQEKGTTNGIITDVSGNFSITVASTSTLVVSYMGYTTQEIPVDGRTAINVTLALGTTKLGEVVVIGYGTVKKSDATGSIVAVSSKDFNRGAITSPQELLVGKSAGVVITSSGGAPGAGAQIRIRGGSSLTASNDPLIIIDGVPVDSRDMGGLSNPLAAVNPNDIETFTVLKDASATAIYGSRASNGVILITTKRGKVGSPFKVSYDGNVSIRNATKFLDVYSGDEFRKMVWDHRALWGNASLSKLGQANTNWQKEIYQTAVSSDHNLSVTGAYKTMPYRVSVGYTGENGILINTGMQRTTAAIGLDPSILDDHLKFTLNAKGMNVVNNYGNTNAIGDAISMDPTQPVMNGNTRYGGYYTWTTNNLPDGDPIQFGANPVAEAKLRDNKSTSKRIIGNVQVDYKFHMIPELRANLNLGIDYTKITGHDNTDTIGSWMRRGQWGQNRVYHGTYSNKVLDFYLNYAKNIDPLSSKVDVTAGYSWNHIRRDEDRLQRNSAIDAKHPYVPAQDSAATATESYLVSFFGRVNYTLKDRYMLTFTLRDDGSSRFSGKNQWGLFPSASFAWKIKDESFLRNIKAITELKIRIGWGVTGQQNISSGDYPSMELYRGSLRGYSYQFGNSFIRTFRPGPFDANLKWESTTTQNAGLDFGFADDRITGSVDIYKRVTDNLLLNANVPNGSNFSNSVLTNVGSMENKGAEFSLNLKPISTKDQVLSVGFNISYNVNKITKLLLTDNPDYPGIPTGGGPFGGNIEIQRVGSAINSFLVNKQVYDVNGNPIEGVYVDLSGNGGAVNNITADKYVYKKPAPDYLMGLSARYSYKNLDISASSRISIGNYVYNNNAASASYDIRYANEYWANSPKFLEDTKFVTRQPYSDYFVENASFFKLDNASAGYRFDNLINRLSVRISFTVQNAFTITKYKGIDPEVSSGVDNNLYPRPRIFLVGVSLTY
jgi:TonB-dependent starch-binding outer membrane protein SusC